MDVHEETHALYREMFRVSIINNDFSRSRKVQDGDDTVRTSNSVLRITKY